MMRLLKEIKWNPYVQLYAAAGSMLVVILFGLILLAQSAKTTELAFPHIDAEAHVRHLGKAGEIEVYSITDLEKGILCYVTAKGICCMADQ